MKLELVLPRDVYLTGENIDIDIRLTNTETAAIDVPTLDSPQNPQPVYHLRGPSYPQGVSFNFRDSRPGAASSPAPEPSLHRLLPGATMETGFTLNSIKPVSNPGEYTISARIDWGGWSAEAAPVKFRVEKARFLESSLGVDVYSRSVRTLRAVWIAESAGKRLLGESFLYEKRPDLGEVNVTATRIIRPIGPKASDPFCPWVNFDRSAAPKFWHGWQEGSALMAFSDDEREPRTFDMGSSKAHIVQPTFMSRSGDLEVLVLGQDRKTLRLIRFRSEPQRSGPEVAWTVELPEEAVGVRLGIGPESGGGVRVAAAVSQTGLKIAIRLIRIGEKSAEIGPSSLVDNAFALPDSEPGISIAPNGSVKVAVLFATHPGRRGLAAADVTAEKNGESRIAVSDVGKIEAAAVGAWIAYQVTSEGPPTRAWLIRTADGSFSGGPPDLVAVATDAPVLDLLRMSGASYVLSLDADRGPRLVATGF
jgi:hypothetical protein